jgi:hypothetical protein
MFEMSAALPLMHRDNRASRYVPSNLVGSPVGDVRIQKQPQHLLLLALVSRLEY